MRSPRSPSECAVAGPASSDTSGVTVSSSAPSLPLESRLAELLGSPARTQELVRLLELKGIVSTVVLEFLDKDLANLTSPHTLFREDSIGTRLLASLAYLLANERFLSATIVPLVHLVRANPKLYLPDPARPAGAKPQIQALRSLVTSFLANVNTHITDCSAVMRFILYQVEEHVQKKFPTHSVLSSLFFLRFLCPAVVRCESFMNLESLSIDERRALVLVTKILQSIANGVDMKEAHLASLNPFVGEQSNSVQLMCKQLIALPSIQVAAIEQLSWRTSLDIMFNPPVAEDTLKSLPALCLEDNLEELHPLQWSVANVQTWLEQESLPELKPTFLKHQVDGISLLLLPESGFNDIKLHKAQRKRVLAAVSHLLSARTKFFPAYKPPSKWASDEVIDYFSFMDLGAFSYVLRSLSSKISLTGSSLMYMRDDEMRILGVDSAADRLAILARVIDVVLVNFRLDARMAVRRASAPSWIERVSRQVSCDSMSTASLTDCE